MPEPLITQDDQIRHHFCKVLKRSFGRSGGLSLDGTVELTQLLSHAFLKPVILTPVVAALAILSAPFPVTGAESLVLESRTETIEGGKVTVDLAAESSETIRNDRRSFTATGKAHPIKFDVYDERTKKMERGLGYPALSTGKLTFADSQDSERWSDPTWPLHFSRGELIATIVDRDLDAHLAAERGRLAPLWAEHKSMLRVQEQNPAATSKLLLAIKEGESLQLETAILEKEMKTALRQAVVAPADVEVIEGTRYSGNINPSSGDLFRYYPLSHIRFLVRLPLSVWGPDRTIDLNVNGRTAQVLRVYSVDLDETNEEWILGIEFKPARSFDSMSEQFHYELTTTAPEVSRLNRGLTLHPPSCALVGRRRTYPATSPKIPGLLFFSKQENSWVNKDESIGGVTLAGMKDLLQKVNQYRSWCDKFIGEAETEFIPSGSLAGNDPQLILLRQYHAEAGRFVEWASAMTIEAKQSGLLVGTLAYQGPLTSGNADLLARIKSPFVEILDVRFDKNIDVHDGDIVFVELPSGTEKLAQVFRVVPETVGSIRDLSATQLVSVLVYDGQFQLGEEPTNGLHGVFDSALESGMPVYVSVPVYSNETDRARIQSRLNADFENRKTLSPSERPLYPIQFTFRNSSLSPLEKMAYMRRANQSTEEGPAASLDYPDLLTAAIIEQQDPEIRWVTLQRLIGLRFTKGFDPFVQIAVCGHPDVASASLFHLHEKRREFELFDVLCRLQEESADWNEESREKKEPLLSLTYELLRGLIDHPHPQSDALTHMIKRGRLDPAFRIRLEEFLFSVVRTEGVNAPASIRILRGKDESGQPFFPESVLEAAMSRCERRGDGYLSRLFQRELDRRELRGISHNSKYGYGANFIETGFLYLRDLERIDLLVRSKENYLHDLRFLESSPRWKDVFPLDPEVLSRLRARKAVPRPVPTPDSASPRPVGFASFGRDIKFSAFRQLTKPERSRLIKDVGTKNAYSTLVLLLRDPFIRRHHAGDILDWLLLTPEARLEVARYYSRCPDSVLLDLIDERHFTAEVLPDIDSTIRRLEKTSPMEAGVVDPLAGQMVSPATIHIYQEFLLRLWERTPTDEGRFNELVTWAGLLPSGFELGEDTSSLSALSRQRGIPEDQFKSAVRYVRERRALKHAVAREREKRAEHRQVEIHPGPEETILRQIVQDVEAGMPPRRHPFALLTETLEKNTARSTPDDTILSLQDTVRLARTRDREFATGKRERLRFTDITSYVSRIILAPLCILAVVPLIWLASIVALLFESLGFRSSFSRGYFRSSVRRAERLLESVEIHTALKREISRWITILGADELNVERLERLQERAKRILNFRDLVYHVSTNGKGSGDVQNDDRHVDRQDLLTPDVATKLAPCLTLLAILTRLTAERIWHELGQEPAKNKRMYLLMEWFLQRSTYFSGYRYALNPLANHQIAESYIWRDIPLIGSRGEWSVVRGLLLPLNLFVGAVNLFGHVFLSLPMRFLYLFTPISLLGAGVFKWSLRWLVIDTGNTLEEDLYPDPSALMKQTRERLRTGWAHRAAQPDQPGGRPFFSFRRVATRVLPFVIVMTIVSGGFPYVYEMLMGNGWASAWNIRSTGVYAAFAALVVLTITMVLHWLPLLMGWIPFAHFRNLNKIRLLRRRARRSLLAKANQRIRGRVNADDELQALDFESAVQHLRAERDSDAPILDLLVLMVEDTALRNRYRALAKSLVSHKTVVLAYPTGESMDGGGARLSTLKTVREIYAKIRERHPHLPERFDKTRSCFLPIGSDCDPLIELPVQITDPAGPQEGESVSLTPFVLAMANVQSLMRRSFVYEEEGETKRFVGSITAAPQRLYVGPHDVDQGGRFRGGITLLGAFESIQTAGLQGALVVVGSRAFIRNSPDQLRSIIQNTPGLHQWLDPDNTTKRQLPVAQLVIERFRTAERYGRHIQTCVRYIDEIQRIKVELLAKGPQGERDVSDGDFLNDIAIHYMRHLIVPWFIAFQGGSLENYRSGVLTGDLGVLDRRRVFHNRVLELIELFQEEGQLARRQLPKVRFVNAPSARIYYAKTSQDAEPLWENPRLLFPAALAKPGTPLDRGEAADSNRNNGDGFGNGRKHDHVGGPANRDQTVGGKF